MTRTEAELTRRQREVLPLVAEGMTNRLIAKELGISLVTATRHVEGAFRCYGAVNRAHLVTLAFRAGDLK